MSRIYFHSLDKESEVYGSERAYMGHLCTDLAYSVSELDSFFFEKSPMLKVLEESNNRKYSKEDAKMAFNLFNSMFFNINWKVNDRNVNSFAVVLNTAMALGGDAIKLYARLHGQCEIHAYVEGEYRSWLADIIDKGVESKILRVFPEDGEKEYLQNQKRFIGWNQVSKHLRENNVNPVVTSYSVCESFPNYQFTFDYQNLKDKLSKKEDLSKDNFHKKIEDWTEKNYYSWSTEMQWRECMHYLRTCDDGLREICPETWDNFYFGPQNDTVFSIIEEVNTAQKELI